MGLPAAIIAVPAAATMQILIKEILSLRKQQDVELRGSVNPYDGSTRDNE